MLQLREAKQQEATLKELTAKAEQRQEGSRAASAMQIEASSHTPENEKSEGDILAEKLEQEQRNQTQQRKKLQNIIIAFRRGET